MGLDSRSKELILYLLQNSSLKSSDIIKKFEISKRQFNYSFGKINEYLQDNYIEEITRTKRGVFIIPISVYNHFHEGIKTINEEYIYSEKERQYLIILSLLSRNEEFSLIHIADKALVSKNTVLTDLKEVQIILNKYRLIVQYNRKNGYQILGNELDKRYLMIEVIREIIRFPNSEQIFNEICLITQEEVLYYSNRIVLTEKSLNIRISDERLMELKYIVLLTVQRIRLNKVLNKLPTDFYSVNGTFEFKKTEFVLRGIKNLTEEENIFMSIHFLISNIKNMNTPVLVEHENIFELAEEIIDNFEQIGCVEFRDKKGLCLFLFQHFKPAFFRIKYNFHIENDITDIVFNEYYYLQEIVKQSIAPIEKKMKKKFPESEIFYILIIIGGWLRKESHIIEPDRIMKAIVICNNGLSVSNYLNMTLKGMFKNIVFIDCISQRDFQKYDKEYDIVFSSNFIETDKKLYIVKPMMTELEKSQFFIKVTCDLLGISDQNIAINQILDIVEKHTVNVNKKKLRQDLIDYFSHSSKDRGIKEHTKTNNEVHLIDVLNKEHILYTNKLYEWEQVIDILSIPLFLDGSIEKEYSVEIKKQIRELHPLLMIVEGFVIMHAGVNNGVHRVAMSLLKLPSKISIDSYMDADLFLMLATPDTKIHLQALNEMLDIFIKDKMVNKLRKAKNEEEMYQLIFNKKS